MRLHVHQWGQGPRVVLVHGGVLGGRETWRTQRPLTERWTLLAPDRPGHGQSPPARQDFEPEAALVADQLLDQPSHLVGHSYGGIVSMYAAAARPANVLSLTIVEPPSTAVARGVPAVDEYAAQISALHGVDQVAAAAVRRPAGQRVLHRDEQSAAVRLQPPDVQVADRQPEDADP